VPRKILVGYDGSDHAKDALALGRALAATTDAALVVAGVFAWNPLKLAREDELDEHEVELAREVERAAAEVGAQAEAFPEDSPARGLHGLAEEIGADLIVVGSSHRAGLGRVLAGSVARGLLQGAPSAVAVAPSGFRDRTAEPRSIGVGVDGSPESLLALELAVELARRSGGSVQALAALDPVAGVAWGYAYSDFEQALRERLQRVLDDALAGIPAELSAQGRLLEDSPAAALVRAAEEEGLDLLCVGSRGYGPLRRVLLGSISAELVETAPCPVVVTPRGSGAEEA
jgi:nucleotide-binding universal stress UspA family protein